MTDEREPVSVPEAGADAHGPRPTGPLELRAAAAALQFLTLAPPLLRRALLPEELGRAIAYYPLVGLLIGGALAALHWALSHVLPTALVSALVLAAWVWASGALHLDGFLDSCDGLFGGFTADDRLRIMRDERVGVFAVVGGVLLLLVKYAALSAVPHPLVALVLAPVLGRWVIAGAIVAFPYARAKGLGRDIKDHADWPHWLFATAIAAAVAAIWGGTPGLLAAAAAALVLLLGGRFVLARIPGMTGDTYGALCEATETLVLIVLAATVGTAR